MGSLPYGTADSMLSRHRAGNAVCLGAAAGVSPTTAEAVVGHARPTSQRRRQRTWGSVRALRAAPVRTVQTIAQVLTGALDCE